MRKATNAIGFLQVLSNVTPMAAHKTVLLTSLIIDSNIKIGSANCKVNVAGMKDNNLLHCCSVYILYFRQF